MQRVPLGGEPRWVGWDRNPRRKKTSLPARGAGVPGVSVEPGRSGAALEREQLGVPLRAWSSVFMEVTRGR